mmetsp:Transcript_171154/g.548604  ORF Transcript_171154/g.548604 Transcript_171154/m.548604 type:complete len:279 (-) Transcript_171154:481-1317(-)
MAVAQALLLWKAKNAWNSEATSGCGTIAASRTPAASCNRLSTEAMSTHCPFSLVMKSLRPMEIKPPPTTRTRSRVRKYMCPSSCTKAFAFSSSSRYPGVTMGPRRCNSPMPPSGTGRCSASTTKTSTSVETRCASAAPLPPTLLLSEGSARGSDEKASQYSVEMSSSLSTALGCPRQRVAMLRGSRSAQEKTARTQGNSSAGRSASKPRRSGTAPKTSTRSSASCRRRSAASVASVITAHAPYAKDMLSWPNTAAGQCALEFCSTRGCCPPLKGMTFG